MSWETIRLWCIEFGPDFARILKQNRRGYGGPYGFIAIINGDEYSGYTGRVYEECFDILIRKYAESRLTRSGLGRRIDSHWKSFESFLRTGAMYINQAIREFVSVWKVILVFSLVGFGLSGCATTAARVDNGAQFAAAGIAYVDALPALLDESFELAVSQNSLLLTQDRELLDEEMRISQLETSDALLTERLSILRDIKRHLLLLRSYFIALRALTTTDGASGITDATNGVIARLQELRPELSTASIGGASPQELVGPAVNLAVGLFQNAALRRELEVHGESIERELALQRALVDALVEDMTSNAAQIILIEEQNPLFNEFVGSGAIPSSWTERRIAAFRQTVELASLDEVRQAASNLHDTWIALVENRTSEAALNLLLQDIEEFLAVARLIRSDP